MGNAQALSKGGKLSAAEALALVETFHDDPERYVIQTAVNLAFAPRENLVPESLMPNYRQFLLKNFQSRARELGWTAKPGESEDIRLLRASLVRPVATWAGDEELAAQAKALTEKWFADHNAIDPNMQGSVLSTAAFYGDKALFDRFLAEFSKSKDKQVRRVLLGAMNSFRDPASIETGQKALLSGTIPFIEGEGILFNGQQQAATRKMPLTFLKNNWDQVVSKMPTGGGFDFGSVLPNVGSSYCDASSRDELKGFFAPRVDKFVGAPRALDQVLEGIDLCIANKAAQTPSVAAFLVRYR
jgi:alanyl aminopeptidase